MGDTDRSNHADLGQFSIYIGEATVIQAIGVARPNRSDQRAELGRTQVRSKRDQLVKARIVLQVGELHRLEDVDLTRLNRCDDGRLSRDTRETADRARLEASCAAQFPYPIA